MGNKISIIQDIERQQQQMAQRAAAEQRKTMECKETFVWTIDNFSAHTCEHLDSGYIDSLYQSGHPLKCRLTICPDGDCPHSRGYISILYTLFYPPSNRVFGNCKFCIRNGNGMNKMKKATGYYNFASGTDYALGNFVDRNLLLNPLYGLLPGDRLTIVVKIKFEAQENALHYGEGNQQQKVPKSQMMVNLSQLLKKSLFTDCQIICLADNKEFKVHKGILACRSPVFAAMFENRMVEAENGIIKIKEIQSEVIQQMLLFIYTGTAPKLDKMAEELLVAADRYQLEDRLKIQCEQSLANSIGIGNVCERLVLANRLSAVHLQANALKFIMLHANEVMKSEGWKLLVKANHDGDVFDQLMKTLAAASK